MLGVAILLAGCGDPESPSPPDVIVEPREFDVAACQPASITEFDFGPAAADPPDRPVGAGEPEEDELNEEEPPPIPDDPSVPLLELTESVFEAPRGAEGEERPEDAIRYGRTTIEPHAVSPQVEPEVAVNGDRILMTWNFMAAVSDDGGASFEFRSPFTTYPDQGDRFWGDQRAEYVAGHDLWLWVLMYKRDAAGQNLIRLGVAPGDTVFDGEHATYYDWTAAETGFPGNVWYDMPKIATTDRHAFLSINAYGSDGSGFKGAILIRMSLDGLAAGADPDAECFFPGTSPTTGYLYMGPYPTRGATSAMYFASHVSTSILGVWRWRDDSSVLTYREIEDGYRWPADQAYEDKAQTDYTCRRVIRAEDGTIASSPESSDWCRRLSDGNAKNDARITSGWIDQGQLGFAWNIPAHDYPDAAGVELPYPAVWITLLDEASLDACPQAECVVDHPWLMNPDYAIQYAAIAPNARGDLGAVVLTGGGNARFGGYLTCMAAVRDQYSGEGWHFIDIAESNVDIPRPSSGDYLGIWPDGGSENSWSGACMTYEQGVGDRVHYARFGRRADLP